MSDTLKPCPFCGSTDITNEDCSDMQTNGTRLSCNECGAQVEGYGGSTCTARAMAKWNARASPSAELAKLRAEVAGLKARKIRLSDLMSGDPEAVIRATGIEVEP